MRCRRMDSSRSRVSCTCLLTRPGSHALGRFRRLLTRSPSCLSKLSGCSNRSTAHTAATAACDSGRSLGCGFVAEIEDGATLREALLAIAGDFSFTWIAESRPLFADLDPRRFAQLHHSPIALLSELTDED